MKNVTLELTEDQYFRLLAYTKADNYSIGEPNIEHAMKWQQALFP